MFTKFMTVGALALATAFGGFAAVPALAADAGEQQTAERACEGFSAMPATVVSSVEDGLGDYLIWLEDAEGTWHMCNARGDGSIFAFTAVEDDIRGGQAPQFTRISSATPADVAVEVCSSVMAPGAVAEHVVVEDGVGDFIVWLTDTNQDLWLCNARGDGQIFAYVPVDMPINDADEPIRFRNT